MRRATRVPSQRPGLDASFYRRCLEFRRSTFESRDGMFDYVIVGAGSAGCVLAHRLSADPQVKVCLLEAGPPDTSPFVKVPLGAVVFLPFRNRHNWAFKTTPQRGLNGRRGYQPRGRTLGGSSAINAMCYIRGQAEDYDGWAANGNTGWGWADVLPYFKRAERQARGVSPLHGADGPLGVSDLRSPNPLGEVFLAAAQSVGLPRNDDFNGPSQEGVGYYQVTQWEGERCSAARAYLAPIRGRDNLAVLTHAHATRLLMEGRRAVGVEYRREGATQIVRASREVVVCSGALQSPQLLMLSGIGPGEHLRAIGLPVVHDLPGVGRNLQDHPDYITGYRSPSREPIGVSLSGAWRLWQAWGEYRRSRRGTLTTNFAEAGGFVRSDASLARPDLQLFFVIAMVDDHARKPHLGHGFSCHVCLLRPRSVGKLELTSPDPLDAPLIDPDFLGDDDDLERLVRGFKLVRKILRAPAFDAYRGAELYTASVNTDEEIRAAIRARADTVYHPVGTCKMGTDAAAVVDPALRVHGVAGLRVADCAIMPSIVSGNTNAPAVMIGEKAADLILADAHR
jgi:choline dehydrogenase-like flavoprotein